MSTREQLNDRLQKVITTGSALQQTYHGNMSLHNAACTVNNKEEIERLRETILDVTGQILDNIRMAFDIVREMGDGPQPR